MVGKYGKNATDELKIKKVSQPAWWRRPAVLCCPLTLTLTTITTTITITITITIRYDTHASRPDAPCPVQTLCCAVRTTATLPMATLRVLCLLPWAHGPGAPHGASPSPSPSSDPNPNPG